MQRLLREYIVLLWQSDETRDRRPTVLDEVRNGLYFFEATLFELVPRIYDELEQALATNYPGETFEIPGFSALRLLDRRRSGRQSLCDP